MENKIVFLSNEGIKTPYPEDLTYSQIDTSRAAQ